jgi:hypothetical protein
VRSFLLRYSWVVVVAMVAGFIWFTIQISKPVEGSLQEGLVGGTVEVAPELANEAVLTYVALHAGRPDGDDPEDPVADQLVEEDRTFAFPADPLDGDTFYVLARVETSTEEFFCERVALPKVRVDDDEWVVAATGEPLEPQRIVVDRSQPCEL